MADARRMGKSELFSHFAERFEVKRTQAREFFDALTELAEKELKRSGEFVLPGMVKLVVQKRKARMGRNPATGEAIKIPAKTVVKARIAKQLKDEIYQCPPLLVLTGRPQDAWLATWSRADGAVSHPIDPIELAETVVALLRARTPATA